jgi:hypothetical protein
MDPQGGGVGAEAVYTIRIKANAKEEIRQRLTQLLGYQHSSLYPDFSGFASFGTLNLRERP